MKILARLLLAYQLHRRPVERCTICDLYSGHDNAAHDRHLASRIGTPVPVDGKPAPRPTTIAEILVRERARYEREVREMNAHLATKEETA
jgi:hypothetical protein